MISEFLKYCYFWIDILGFLTQAFKPAPHMFSYGVPPGGNNMEMKGNLFSKGRGAHKHFFDRNARTRTNFDYPKK